MDLNSIGTLDSRRLDRGLLLLGLLFLAVTALTLTLAPSVLEGEWQLADISAMPWLLVAAWTLAAAVGHLLLGRWLPQREPVLFPLAMFMAGWGILEIWRLAPGFGLRQAAWLLVSVAGLLAVARTSADMRWLRRYRYLWLFAGLGLTALTLLLGVNPSGFGPRLWLGCCRGLIAGEGLYFQPSEGLKILLVAYLAAYLADRRQLLDSRAWACGPLRLPHPAYLLPLVLMWGFSMVVLASQQDLGTGSLFFAVFLVMLYLASGDWLYLASGLFLLIAAGVAGYLLFDLVRLRIDAWWNPWADASGRSYQIVQSLIAVGSGGVLGSGIGLGAPAVVPVAHSDFIFSAIAEEWGLAGVLGLIAAFALVVLRGFRVALRAGGGSTPAEFRVLLAGGLSAMIGLQGLLIMGGAIRLLPLTGVPLPFVSYGGSALLANFLMLGLLLKCSAPPQ